MIHFVAGTMSKAHFEWAGRLTAVRIIDLLQSNDFNLAGGKNILDFGCGCGRILRYIIDYVDDDAMIYGVDTEKDVIDWCKKYLEGDYQLNQGSPPLNFKNNFFDLIISYSVFTHIHAKYQLRWFREMNRILSSSGYFIFSTMGYDSIKTHSSVTEQDMNKFSLGEIVTPLNAVHDGYVAESSYGTFHSLKAVNQVCKESGFKLVKSFMGQKAPPMNGAGQDLHLAVKN